MNTYDFVHLALLALGGEIKGNTKLQKTIYFVGVMTGSIEELGYRPHFYGPYSDEVADAAARLQGLGFLKRTSDSGGGYDSRGFEVVRYDYALTEEGQQIAKEKAALNHTLWKKIQKAVDILKSVGDQDYMKLSVAAKTYFTLCQKSKLPGQERKATMEVLAELAKKFGWTVEENEVAEAAELLKSIGLVSLSS